MINNAIINQVLCYKVLNVDVLKKKQLAHRTITIAETITLNTCVQGNKASALLMFSAFSSNSFHNNMQSAY